FHLAAPWWAAERVARRAISRSPRQMPVIRRRPGKCSGSSGLRPAERSQPCTWLSAKPRWTWACSRFSSTRSCGEKSTTKTTPPSRARSNIQQAAGAARQVMGEAALDLAVGDVQRAQFVPALRIVAEEPDRRRLPPLLQRIEPRPVRRQPRMLGIEPSYKLPD